MLRSLLLVFLVAVLPACLSSAPPLERRFFEPGGGALRTGDVELGRLVVVESVRAGPTVRESQAWRLSDVEVAFDETASWIASPAALTHARLLGRVRAATPVDANGERPKPGLNVLVSRFEGVLDGEARARVVLEVQLQWGQVAGKTTERARLEREVPLTARSSDALAIGIGAALDGAVDDLLLWLAPLVE
jgi:uncharacterized lipoprotein YmbA